MLDIEVRPPIKSDCRYEFQCVLRGDRSRPRELLRRGTAMILGRRSPPPTMVRFGYRAVNFTIRHHEIWDAVYPLLFLTRNGGPLFGKQRERARVRFAYPIPGEVRDFYIRRAADFGIEISVEADLVCGRLDGATDRHVLAFGGGKDSRLILGVLRELGMHPLPITADAANTPDVPEALITESVNGVLADRVMPALMALGRHFYFGSGLGEVHRETPWQQYFDLASPWALAELSRLLGSLGVLMDAHAPVSVLPYNIIQRILCERYPQLFEQQRSVAKDELTEKNLHVSLCEVHHGIPFQRHCSEQVFRALLDDFVRRQTASPGDFGYRNHREPIRREMRAIVFRHREDPLFAGVRGRIPADWDGAWIDYIHSYVSPLPPEGFLPIFSQYAPTVDMAPADVRIWRLRT